MRGGGDGGVRGGREGIIDNLFSSPLVTKPHLPNNVQRHAHVMKHNAEEHDHEAEPRALLEEVYDELERDLGVERGGEEGDLVLGEEVAGCDCKGGEEEQGSLEDEEDLGAEAGLC